MATDGQPPTVSPYPPPPAFYKLYGDANAGPLPPEPPTTPIPVFGQELNLHEALTPPLQGEQLYKTRPDGSIDYKQELSVLNKQLMFLFMELNEVLIEQPSLYARPLTNIKKVFNNMVHLVNAMRPHQARATLEYALATQLQEKQQALQQLRQQRQEADGVIRQAAEELLRLQQRTDHDRTAAAAAWQQQAAASAAGKAEQPPHTPADSLGGEDGVAAAGQEQARAGRNSDEGGGMLGNTPAAAMTPALTPAMTPPEDGSVQASGQLDYRTRAGEGPTPMSLEEGHNLGEEMQVEEAQVPLAAPQEQLLLAAMHSRASQAADGLPDLAGMHSENLQAPPQEEEGPAPMQWRGPQSSPQAGSKQEPAGGTQWRGPQAPPQEAGQLDLAGIESRALLAATAAGSALREDDAAVVQGRLAAPQDSRQQQQQLSAAGHTTSEARRSQNLPMMGFEDFPAFQPNPYANAAAAAPLLGAPGASHALPHPFSGPQSVLAQGPMVPVHGGVQQRQTGSAAGGPLPPLPRQPNRPGQPPTQPARVDSIDLTMDEPEDHALAQGHQLLSSLAHRASNRVPDGAVSAGFSQLMPMQRPSSRTGSVMQDASAAGMALADSMGFDAFLGTGSMGLGEPNYSTSLLEAPSVHLRSRAGSLELPLPDDIFMSGNLQSVSGAAGSGTGAAAGIGGLSGMLSGGAPGLGPADSLTVSRMSNMLAGVNPMMGGLGAADSLLDEMLNLGGKQ